MLFTSLAENRLSFPRELTLVVFRLRGAVLQLSAEVGTDVFRDWFSLMTPSESSTSDSLSQFHFGE